MTVGRAIVPALFGLLAAGACFAGAGSIVIKSDGVSRKIEHVSSHFLTTDNYHYIVAWGEFSVVSNGTASRYVKTLIRCAESSSENRRTMCNGLLILSIPPGEDLFVAPLAPGTIKISGFGAELVLDGDLIAQEFAAPNEESAESLVQLRRLRVTESAEKVRLFVNRDTASQYPELAGWVEDLEDSNAGREEGP